MNRILADMDAETVHIHDLAVGGEGVGRLEDGRAVFVAATIPGETVRVELIERKKRWARGICVEVLDAAPGRIEPTCEAVGRGCGGCDWQHLEVASRSDLIRGVVDSVLQRQAGIGGECSFGGAVPAFAYRTTLRTAVRNGKAGFRAARSNDLVVVDRCEVAEVQLADLFLVDWASATEVTFRCGARTGERLVVVDPTVPDDLDIPEGVRAVGVDDLSAGKRAWIHENAAGRTWRLSAESFFQSGPEAAELLAATVGRLIADELRAATTIADLYSGVGLFAGALSHLTDAKWTVVESSPSAIADSRINLADISARFVRTDVSRFRDGPFDVVIADPPRSGLRDAGVRTIAAIRGSTVCLVSCDLGAFGRDARQLQAAGFRWRESVALDLFPQTSHVELVSVFDR